MRIIRVYADTSVYGSVFDEEFSEPSQTFFQNVRDGRFRLVLSDVVAREIHGAPEQVRSLFTEMMLYSDVAENLNEAVLLQQSYLRHGIVGAASMTDALHVAAATVSGCQILLSWNLKHIVHYLKIPLYNRAFGYHEIAIHTPLEVSYDEDQDF